MRSRLICTMLVCLTTGPLAAFAQTPPGAQSAKTIRIELKVVDLEAGAMADIQSLSKEPGKLASLLREGKARISTSIDVLTRSGEQASVRSGQRVPIQTGSTPIAPGSPAGGLLAVPIITYQNVGMNADLTPRLEPDGTMVIRIKLELSGLLDNSPILTPGFSDRTMYNSVQLQPDKPTVLFDVSQSPPRATTGASGPSAWTYVVLITAHVEN